MFFLLCSGLSIRAQKADFVVVAENHHDLRRTSGNPFFYLGDTAWELFHRLSLEDTEYYLKDRAQKGFTVVQAVAVAELDGVTEPNRDGRLPFVDKDPSRPDLDKNPGGMSYWDHVDRVLEMAAKNGITIGFLPTWGRWWHDEGQIYFNKENAYAYGLFLGKRYKNADLIWILGGDRNPENETQREIVRALAKGLRDGDGHNHLISYHPGGGFGSSEFWNDEDWIDLHMRQNGHGGDFVQYAKTEKDYFLKPLRPVIDAEPLYEDHPLSFRAQELGYSTAADVRRALYWDLMGGAAGHTYGHHSIWQMYEEGLRGPVNNPLMSWKEALSEPGASQMVLGRRLIESRPSALRVPCTDEALLVEGNSMKVPGSGRYHMAALKDSEGAWLMVYVPVGRSFTVRKSVLPSGEVKAWWYDPRTGDATSIGTLSGENDQTFCPPTIGEALDWVLVLDRADKGYPAPGKSF